MRCVAAGILTASLSAGACSGSGDLGGTLVYSEHDTGHVHIRDLGTGADTLVDSGIFGSVSVAPDGRHVAYATGNEKLTVADRDGTHMPLTQSGSCGGPATWISNTSVMYCVSGGTMLLPALGGAARFLDSYGVASSADAQTIAHVSASGEMIVEALDGASQRVLVPSPDPSVVNPTTGSVGFTPDQRGLIVSDTRSFPPELDVIALADGATTNLGDVYFPSTPFGSTRFLGVSPVSSDGSELLLQSSTALVAVTLATGAKRTISTFAERESAGGAAFLDDSHVLWVRVDDMSVGDEGSFSVSLHIAGPDGSDVVVQAHSGQNATWPTIAVLATGDIAAPGVSLLVTQDGTEITSNLDESGDLIADDILGLTAGGNGVITAHSGGSIHFVSADGTATLVVSSSPGGPDVIGPYAAYAP